MLSLPRPRTSLREQEQFLERASAARPARRCCRRRARAVMSRQAVGDVFERGLPVDRLPLAALLEHRRGQALVGCSAPSYEKRSRSDSQHSLTASFSSGSTRITRSFLTCTIRLRAGASRAG